MSPFRVAVVGPAAFGDYRLLSRKLDLLLARRIPRVELLAGDGPGVAELVGWYAHANGSAAGAVSGRPDERVRWAESSMAEALPPEFESFPEKYPPAAPTTNAATGRIQGFFIM